MFYLCVYLIPNGAQSCALSPKLPLVHHLICLLCKFRLFLLLCSLSLHANIKLQNYHLCNSCGNTKKSQFYGEQFFVAHLVVLFHFLASPARGGGKRHPIGWGMVEWGDGVVTEFRHFFKCSLYYDISCRTIFLYVNKFLCNITQFANVQRKRRERRGRQEEGGGVVATRESSSFKLHIKNEIILVK